VLTVAVEDEEDENNIPGAVPDFSFEFPSAESRSCRCRPATHPLHYRLYMCRGAVCVCVGIRVAVHLVAKTPTGKEIEAEATS
jgi:hypothetical protein